VVRVDLLGGEDGQPGLAIHIGVGHAENRLEPEVVLGPIQETADALQRLVRVAGQIGMELRSDAGETWRGVQQFLELAAQPHRFRLVVVFGQGLVALRQIGCDVLGEPTPEVCVGIASGCLEKAHGGGGQS
jgi:hypothetical protein